MPENLRKRPVLQRNPGLIFYQKFDPYIKDGLAKLEKAIELTTSYEQNKKLLLSSPENQQQLKQLKEQFEEECKKIFNTLLKKIETPEILLKTIPKSLLNSLKQKTQKKQKLQKPLSDWEKKLLNTQQQLTPNESHKILLSSIYDKPEYVEFINKFFAFCRRLEELETKGSESPKISQAGEKLISYQTKLEDISRRYNSQNPTTTSKETLANDMNVLKEIKFQLYVAHDKPDIKDSNTYATTYLKILGPLLEFKIKDLSSKILKQSKQIEMPQTPKPPQFPPPHRARRFEQTPIQEKLSEQTPKPPQFPPPHRVRRFEQTPIQEKLSEQTPKPPQFPQPNKSLPSSGSQYTFKETTLEEIRTQEATTQHQPWLPPIVKSSPSPSPIISVQEQPQSSPIKSKSSSSSGFQSITSESSIETIPNETINENLMRKILHLNHFISKTGSLSQSSESSGETIPGKIIHNKQLMRKLLHLNRFMHKTGSLSQSSEPSRETIPDKIIHDKQLMRKLLHLNRFISNIDKQQRQTIRKQGSSKGRGKGTPRGPREPQKKSMKPNSSA